MGRSVNKVTLIGTLGRDPEVRYMPNGNAVANLSLATDESYNDRQTGQKVEQTEWHRITIYGKLAEIVQQYLKKGAKAYFEGKLRTREWEKDGVKRYTTEIIANDMLMLDGRGGDASGGMGNAGMGNTGMGGGYQQPQSAASMMNPASGMGGSAPQGGQGGYGQAPQQPAQAPGGYQPPAQQAPAQPPAQPAPTQQPVQQPTHQPAPAPGGYQPPASAPGGYQQAPQQAPQPPHQPARQPAPQQPAQTPPPANNFDDFDDDIPF